MGVVLDSVCVYGGWSLLIVGGVLDGFQCFTTNFDSSFCTCIYSGHGFNYTAFYKETKRTTTFVLLCNYVTYRHIFWQSMSNLDF